MEKFSEELESFRKENTLTKQEMAEILGISNRMYMYYEKGEYDGNPVKVARYLQKLANFRKNKNSNLGQEIAEQLKKERKIKLIEEDYSEFAVSDNASEVAKSRGKSNDYNKGVPVYDLEATAGNVEFYKDMPELIKGYINLPSFNECTGFLYVRGDSMYPTFKAGDLIGVIPVNDMDIIQFGHTYLVITIDNQRMLKNIRKGKSEEELILRSKNPDYDDINILKSKVTKLYRVKGPIRDDWQ